jgi:predicted metal-dependent peptidase
MLGEPYLAAAVARLPVVNKTNSPWCDTFATDGYNIFYNEAFADTLSEPELSFVLAHETLHCVLGHMDRRGERERLRWNVAIDYATNALLVAAGMTMPKDGLYAHEYRSMTAEEIYKRLPASQSLQPGNRRSRGGKTRSGRRPSDTPGVSTRHQPGAYDRHIEPNDAEGEEHRGEDFPSPEERRRMRTALTRELLSTLAGKVAGYFEAEITAATASEIPWQQILARFVNGIRRSDYSLYPFNRKHLWRGLYLPSIGVPGPRHLVIAVDTSGSMPDDVLSQILAEIDRIRAVTECTLTVVECDVIVHRAATFEAFEPSAVSGTHRFMGRGGTDLRAPFDWLRDKTRSGEIVADALIFATDGYGPLPENEPDLPVLWIVPPHGLPKFPFGIELRLAK